jgi:hypothetical protein
MRGGGETAEIAGVANILVRAKTQRAASCWCPVVGRGYDVLKALNTAHNARGRAETGFELGPSHIAAATGNAHPVSSALPTVF